MLDLVVKSTQESQYTTARPTAKASSEAAAPVLKAEAVKPAEFISSPKGRIDSGSGMFVIQFRDRSSGEVTMEYPSKKAAGVYKKADSLVPSESTSTGPAPTVVADPVSTPAPASQETQAAEAPSAMEKSGDA